MKKIIAILAIAALGIAIAWISNHQLGLVHQARSQANRSRQERTYEFTKLREGEALSTLTLPGTLRALQTSTLVARATGYVSRLEVRIGAHVRRGETIAAIATPEVDAQLEYARARKVESEANLELARSALARLESVEGQGASTRQMIEDAQTRLNTQVGQNRQNRAEIQRLEALVSFERVTAPFDGVITQRLIDNGALVSAGSTPIVEIAEDGLLRVEVDIPQTFASNITVGMPAKVVPRGERLEVQGTVARTSGAIDRASRTLRVEVEIPRTEHTTPGAYANVLFEVNRADPPLLLSSNALSVTAQGNRVAVLDEQNHVHWRTVQISRDMGRDIELLPVAEEGLVKDARILLYPPATLQENQEIRVSR